MPSPDRPGSSRVVRGSVTIRRTVPAAASRWHPSAPAGVVRPFCPIFRYPMTKPSDKTLLLVDGSSYLFRAYHALPDLRNKAGEPTGAIHGMVGMLRRLRDDTRLHGGATRGAVIFDAPGRTFRDDLYEHYKANRASTPEDLVAQIAPIHELTQDMIILLYLFILISL